MQSDLTTWPVPLHVYIFWGEQGAVESDMRYIIDPSMHTCHVHHVVYMYFLGGGVTRVRRLVCATSGLRGGSLKNTRASIINCWRLAFLFGLERDGLSELLLLSLIRWLQHS